MNKLIMTVKSTGKQVEVKPFNILEHIKGETRLPNGAIVGKYKNSGVHIDTSSGDICFIVN